MQNLHYFISTEIPHDISFFVSNYSKIKNIMRLRGFPYEVRAEVIKKVVEKAEESGNLAQIIHDSRDNSVCGVIVQDVSAGVFFEREETKDCEKIKKEATEIFAEAKKIHDKQEEIYIKNMNFDRLNELGAVASQMFFSVKKTCKNDLPGNDIHRFFGAATADGNINYIPSLTHGLKNRYFIKGRPGTGKSTFLKKIAAAGINSGYDIEMYHCSLDPKSLDMIIVRDLGLCVFDSTAPHEYFPERCGDGIIDIYGMCVVPGTDEKFSTELGILKQKYDEVFTECRKYLKKYNDVVKQTEKNFLGMSKEATNRLVDDVLKTFF